MSVWAWFACVVGGGFGERKGRTGRLGGCYYCGCCVPVWGFCTLEMFVVDGLGCVVSCGRLQCKWKAEGTGSSPGGESEGMSGGDGRCTRHRECDQHEHAVRTALKAPPS